MNWHLALSEFISLFKKLTYNLVTILFKNSSHDKLTLLLKGFEFNLNNVWREVVRVTISFSFGVVSTASPNSS